ncbi:hypothetical protein MVLG_02266 [Microbotryum lychnidis-dioicae p1A1 Lamole]|uniref:ZZ-type domain-containing protein n=1 Tax=Microbotryum lychnidis-dioicae (strain p1A1 Lamole / MvSl-1064) TaxID=683840 RepID=U5H4M8_USTV1|nr:hypothetical protein MVLG_02266 [Microbotryum lychnidis-dioicae p1A1 Lamole]|eukprot:KDE07399.1 hypothetical protein MVLG_02266 [Microbotryum lychnidis-dioicae p1A1 Lamole]
MTSLIVKAQFGPNSSLSRRVTFPNLDTVYIEAFKEKIRHCFSLPEAFRIAYRDDDGDETEIFTSDDLIEAIHFFADDESASSYDGASPSPTDGSSPSTSRKKITMKVYILVDIVGPPLSGYGAESMYGGTTRTESASGRGSTSRSSRFDEGSRNADSWSQDVGNYRGYDHDEDAQPLVSLSHSSAFNRTNEHETRRSYGQRRRDRGQLYGGNDHPKQPISRHSPSRTGIDPYVYPYPNRYEPHAFRPHPSASPTPFAQSDFPPARWQLSPPAQTPRNATVNPFMDSGSDVLSYAVPPGRPANVAPPSYPSRPASDGESVRTASTVDQPSSTGWALRVAGSSVSSKVAGTTGKLFSAPPTYMSGSSNGSTGSGPSLGERSARPRLSEEEHHLARLNLNEGASGRGTERMIGAYPSEEIFPVETHLNARLLDNVLPSSSHTNHTGSNFDLPGFLADLSRSSLPAPSVLSAVRDDMLRCCGCAKVMSSFRYICASCGPILPDGMATSDDGTQIGSTTSDSASNGKVSEREEQEAAKVHEDPLGVNVWNSDASKGKAKAESPSHHHDASSPLLAHPHEGTSSDLLQHEEARHHYGHDERGGFELCSDCVETEGARHANAMRALEKERAVFAHNGSGENGDEMVAVDELSETVRTSVYSMELSHAFAEVVKMSATHGWREVDYDDDVHCSTCGTGPVQTNRFKCLSCSKFELCLSCYRNVEDIHPIHSFLTIPDRPARPKISPTGNHSFGMNSPDQSSGFSPLNTRGVEHSRYMLNGDNSFLTSPTTPSSSIVRHEGVVCFGCSQDIVGPRYSCSVCPSFDLCTQCEANDLVIELSQGRHIPDHILLKINIPVSKSEVLDEAAHRAQSLTHSPQVHHGNAHGRPGPRWFAGPLATRSGFGPWTHEHHSSFPPNGMDLRRHHLQLTTPWGGSSPAGYAHSALAGGAQSAAQPPAWSAVVHHVPCQGCGQRYIRGTRWTCAQCPSVPSTYDLCSNCEPSSHNLHDPLHCFLRLTQPLQKPLPSLNQLLPILYDPLFPPPRRGKEVTARGSDDSSPTSSLSPRDQETSDPDHDSIPLDLMVLHGQVYCDICAELIQGPWLRCCHCPAFDACVACLERSSHHAPHVFVKFTRRVDLPLLRDLTRMSTHNPQPLLTYSVYS